MEQFKQNDVLLLHRNSEAEKRKTNYYGLSQLQNQHLSLSLIKKIKIKNKNIILCEFCRKIFICLAYSLLVRYSRVWFNSLQNQSSWRTFLSFWASSLHSISGPRILFSSRTTLYVAFLYTSILLLLSLRLPLRCFRQLLLYLHTDGELFHNSPEKLAYKHVYFIKGMQIFYLIFCLNTQ